MKILVLALGLSSALSAQTLFTDSFNSASLNSSLWTVATPFSDSYVSVTGGYVQLEDGGRITTTTSFAAPIEITGRIELSGNWKNNSKIVLRTDGAQYFSEVKGVVIQFSPQKDNGSYVDQLSVFTIGEATQTFATLTTPIALDTWYDFRITDDGNTVSLFWDGSLSASLSYTTTFQAGDFISFYSREGAGNGSFISDGGRGRLDSFTVSAVPEPAIVASVSGLAALLLVFAAKRRTRLRGLCCAGARSEVRIEQPRRE